MSKDVYFQFQNLQFDMQESNTINIFEALQNGLFIVEDGFDELAYLRHSVRRARYSDRELKLVIAPTMNCNYSCHYCFEEKSSAVLTKNSQRRILELVAKRLPGREALGVQWFGGEPLMEFEVIQQLSDALMQIAEQASASYAATVVSNGALLSSKMAKRLQECGVKSVQVTLDGDQQLHDKTRNDRTGSSSYRLLIDNIAAASEYLIMQVRIHVAPFSVDRVLSLIDDLSTTDVVKTAAEIYFSPLFHYIPDKSSGIGDIAVRKQFSPDKKRFFTAKEFASVETMLYEKAVEAGFPLPSLFDAPFSVCTAVEENTLVIGPRGNLYKCYFDLNQSRERIGSLDQGVSPSNKLLYWENHEIARDEECEECTFLPVCFGGCSKKWQTGAPKETVCTPLRYNLGDLLPLYSREDQLE